MLQPTNVSEVSSIQPVVSIPTFSQLGTYKDSRWLTLEVCREFRRSKCSRSDLECKFAHPPSHVEVVNGRVTACYDNIKGKCTRAEPPCKYLHPPQHLREQLIQNGKQNLLLRNLHLQALQHNLIQAPLPTYNLVQANPVIPSYGTYGLPQYPCAAASPSIQNGLPAPSLVNVDACSTAFSVSAPICSQPPCNSLPNNFTSMSVPHNCKLERIEAEAFKQRGADNLMKNPFLYWGTPTMGTLYGGQILSPSPTYLPVASTMYNGSMDAYGAGISGLTQTGTFLSVDATGQPASLQRF